LVLDEFFFGSDFLEGYYFVGNVILKYFFIA